MERLLSLRPQVEEYIQSYLSSNGGRIYEPVEYIMSLGGKRIRPCILLGVAQGLGVQVKEALPLAAAIEVFHNFTLLHDDIMDEAETRRGRPAVHVKWNRDQAILSGDVMFAMSYELLMRSESADIRQTHALMSTTAKEVCIGQQMDMDFELRDDVTEDQYLEMIRLKTSVLLGASAAMGAIAANSEEECVDALYRFGQNIGLSFQIQDDILDAFGNSGSVGKRIGGDILNNKKTLLFIRALKMTNDVGRNELNKWSSVTSESEEKIEIVKSIIKDSGALDSVRSTQEHYLREALSALDESGLRGAWYDELRSLSEYQLARQS